MHDLPFTGITSQLRAQAHKLAHFAARLVLALAVALQLTSPVQAEEANEYVVKAAFIYNFAKFTTWPAESFSDPAAPIDLCVIGKHEFGTAFDSVQGKSVGGRTVNVKYLNTLKAQDKCHVVFIARSEQSRVPRIVKANQTIQALTVSDVDGFVEEGGMIRLVREPDDRISFEINPKTAEEAGLKLSSRLLNLAKRIVN
jgi:hypothetical protein